MAETIFPQSPNWNFPKILSTREDGSVAYGSQNSLFILKHSHGQIVPLVIIDAHSEKITSVVFSPNNKNEKIQNLVLSSSDDGFLKLWNVDSLSPVIGHNSHWVQKNPVKVVCATWSPCNPQYIVSAAENETLILWDILYNTTTRFFFPKLKPSVIESSFHNEKILGVGSKNGLVYIIRLVGKGEILHRLRGHDKEVQGLSWSPISYSNLQQNTFEKYHLASSCQEKEIFIWQTLDGECVTKIQLPKNSLSNDKGSKQGGKWDANINFIPIFWASPYHLYSGTKSGELICCDLTSIFQFENDAIRKKQQDKIILNAWKLVHAFHSNALLAVVGIPLKFKSKNVDEVDDTLSNDLSNIGINSNDCNSNNIPCHKNEICYSNSSADNASSQMQSLIWTIAKDQKLIAIRMNSPTDPVFYFHTINGSVFVGLVSPHDPNKLAIGAGDGKIRLWNVSKSSGHSRVFQQKINGRVYSLAWHPLKEGILAYGTSEGRVGIVDVYSQKQPSNFIERHNWKVYGLSWGPSCLEKEDSSTEAKDLSLYSVGGFKLLRHNPTNLNSDILVIPNVHSKSLVDLCWKSDFTLLALGSNKGHIYLVKPPKLEVVCKVHSSSKCIMSLTWHPAATTVDLNCFSFHGYLTFASVDKENVIKVYNCTEHGDSHMMDQVSVLKGHSDYIQHVSWSPHVSGRLISCSADCSVRIWDVTTSTQLMKFPVGQAILPYICLWSPIDPDVIIAGFSERMVLSWRILTSSCTEPIVKVLKLGKENNVPLSELVNGSEVCPTENDKEFEGNSQSVKNEINELTLAKRSEDQKSVKENKMFTKAWKPSADPFLNCYELLKTNETESDLSYKLYFLDSESNFLDFLKTEAESYERANNWSEHYQLALWRGNLKEVLEEKIATGHLDDFLVSLAPFVSPRLWQQACASYSKTLAERKCYRKAACYLMAVHKVYDAIDLLLNAHLYLEAICIARCRLPKSDPIYLNLIRKYAEWLTNTGTLLRAAECFIYLNDFSEAAKVLARKNQPENLSLAALASKKACLEDLECDYSYRALVLCLETDKWELASRICDDHPNLKKISLLYRTYQLLYEIDTEELTLEKDLITHLKEICKIEHEPASYKNLQYTYDGSNIYLDKKNMYVILAHELSLACCATEKDTVLTHIIKAMNIASKYLQKEEEIPIVYKLSSWISPKGDIRYEKNRDSIFSWNDEDIKPKIISLRAFLCLGIVDLMRSISVKKVDSISDMNHLAWVDELINDALDRETFIYFKNQLEMKSLEKRINEAYKRKNQQKDTFCPNEEMKNKTNVPECLIKYLRDVAEPDEKINDVSEEDIIASDKERINQLKADMRNFEKSRIVAPNPAFMYCKLRQVLQVNNESEILSKVEKKWEELQVE